MRIVIFIFALSVSAVAQARTCSSVHQDSAVLRILRQVQNLNPALGRQSTDLPSLYLELKKEEWTYRPIPLREPPKFYPLPAELKEYLLAKQGDKYKIGESPDEEISRFYVNALRNQYMRTAQEWKEREVSRLTQGRHIEVAVAILNQSMSYRSLNDRELNPLDAEKFFAEQSWQQFPWNQAMTLVDQFEASGIEFSRNQFMAWAGQQPQSMSFADLTTVAQALEFAKSRKPTMCCVASKGCFDCPLNRRWIKKD